LLPEYIWFYISPPSPIEIETQKDVRQSLQEHREGLTILHELKRRTENKEAQAQQQTRTLTQEQRRTLIQRLREGPKGRVRISYTTGDAEADRFATQLYEILVRADWPREPLVQATYIGELPVGLQLAVSRPQRGGPDAEMPPHGELLLQALRELGLEVSLGIPMGNVPAEVVHLSVGAKAQPR
jgi:hypothetical protein